MVRRERNQQMAEPSKEENSPPAEPFKDPVDKRLADSKGEQAKTSKGEQTRALILETALDLFKENGYEETTMRAIAARAGVALGNAYYYFRSKEHLIQAFYGRTHEEHLLASIPILKSQRTLKGRLLGVMRAKLETIEPYH